MRGASGAVTVSSLPRAFRRLGINVASSCVRDARVLPSPSLELLPKEERGQGLVRPSAMSSATLRGLELAVFARRLDLRTNWFSPLNLRPVVPLTALVGEDCRAVGRRLRIEPASWPVDTRPCGVSSRFEAPTSRPSQIPGR